MKDKQTFYGSLEAWVSIAGNTLLFVLKYWAGIVSSSIALIADAWHTISDSISSVIVLIGVKVSGRPADKEHPFGHGRAELIASVIVGVLLAVIGFEFIVKGIDKIRNREEAAYGTVAIVVTIISILLKELLAQFAFWTGRKTNMKSLSADGWHHRSDAISSVVVLAGIFLGKYYWWIDGVLSMLVGLLIFYASYRILKEGISPLIGEVPDAELINRIKKISNKVANAETELHHFHIHRYGNHTEITFHMRLPRDYNLEKVHNIATIIETNIREELGIEATVHAEPLK